MLMTATMVASGEKCGKRKNKLMQEEFSNCTMEYRNEYHDTKGAITRDTDLQAVTCLLFSQTIDKCGLIWNICHDQEDIRKMKDMYITALVGQYSDSGEEGVDVNMCDIVREYRQDMVAVVHWFHIRFFT